MQNYLCLFSSRVMTATIKSPDVQNALIASYVTMASPPLMRSNRPPKWFLLLYALAEVPTTTETTGYASEDRKLEF